MLGLNLASPFRWHDLAMRIIGPARRRSGQSLVAHECYLSFLISTHFSPYLACVRGLEATFFHHSLTNCGASARTGASARARALARERYAMLTMHACFFFTVHASSIGTTTLDSHTTEITL